MFLPSQKHVYFTLFGYNLALCNITYITSRICFARMLVQYLVNQQVYCSYMLHNVKVNDIQKCVATTQVNASRIMLSFCLN